MAIARDDVRCAVSREVLRSRRPANAFYPELANLSIVD
jgi:hypothetical protein